MPEDSRYLVGNDPVLPLFATRFAACTGGIFVSFLEACLLWQKMLCMENWFRFIRMKSFDYIFHVVAIWAVRPFIAVLTSNPTVYIMVCPQTLAEICKNMGICDVFKAVDTGQNIYGFYCIVNDVIWSAVYEIIDTKRNLRGNLSNVIVIIVCADGHAPPGACHQHGDDLIPVPHIYGTGTWRV